MLKEKGITLIALVITIIVLLILAGVTLATVTGYDGILPNAKKGTESYLKHNMTLNELTIRLDNVSNDFLFIGTIISDIAEDESAIPMNITDLDWNLMRYRAYRSLEATGLKKNTKPKSKKN